MIIEKKRLKLAGQKENLIGTIEVKNKGIFDTASNICIMGYRYIIQIGSYNIVNQSCLIN